VDKNSELFLTGPVNHGVFITVRSLAWKPVRTTARRVFCVLSFAGAPWRVSGRTLARTSMTIAKVMDQAAMPA
jgi:hypothetical protein